MQLVAETRGARRTHRVGLGPMWGSDDQQRGSEDKEDGVFEFRFWRSRGVGGSVTEGGMGLFRSRESDRVGWNIECVHRERHTEFEERVVERNTHDC